MGRCAGGAPLLLGRYDTLFENQGLSSCGVLPEARGNQYVTRTPVGWDGVLGTGAAAGMGAPASGGREVGVRQE